MAQTASKPTSLRMDLDETLETGEAVTLEDGVHRGVIADAYAEQTKGKDGETYKYFQLDVTPKDQPDMTLRYGCPIPDGRPITNQSKLGKLLASFGFDIAPGKQYTIREMVEALKGREVSFQTINKPNKTGTATFANIVDDSIKPVKSK